MRRSYFLGHHNLATIYELRCGLGKKHSLRADPRRLEKESQFYACLKGLLVGENGNRAEKLQKDVEHIT